MIPLDHLLAVFFGIGFPLVCIPLYARRRPALEAGDARTKRREYVESIAWLAGMGVATVALWVLSGRDFDLLGLGWPGTASFWITLGLILLVASSFFMAPRLIGDDEQARAAVRQKLQPVREYVPANAAEYRLFRGVALSAGVGEEIFYRGFLIWYLGTVLSLPLAVVVSSLLFGAAHAMHGAQATVRASIIGAALAGLYLVSGALWAPMLLHTAIDLSNGATGLRVFSAREDSDPA